MSEFPMFPNFVPNVDLGFGIHVSGLLAMMRPKLEVASVTPIRWESQTLDGPKLLDWWRSPTFSYLRIRLHFSVLDAVNLESEHFITVQNEMVIDKSAFKPEDLRTYVYGLLRDCLNHELDEGFWINGKQLRDPHASDKPHSPDA